MFVSELPPRPSNDCGPLFPLFTVLPPSRLDDGCGPLSPFVAVLPPRLEDVCGPLFPLVNVLPTRLEVDCGALFVAEFPPEIEPCAELGSCGALFVPELPLRIGDDCEALFPAELAPEPCTENGDIPELPPTFGDDCAPLFPFVTVLPPRLEVDPETLAKIPPGIEPCADDAEGDAWLAIELPLRFEVSPFVADCEAPLPAIEVEPEMSVSSEVVDCAIPVFVSLKDSPEPICPLVECCGRPLRPEGGPPGFNVDSAGDCVLSGREIVTSDPEEPGWWLEIRDDDTPDGKRETIKQEQALETIVGSLEQYFSTRDGNGSMYPF